MCVGPCSGLFGGAIIVRVGVKYYMAARMEPYYAATEQPRVPEVDARRNHLPMEQ